MSQANVTKPVTKSNFRLNSLKRRVLGVFASERNWLDVPTLAKRVGCYPMRGMYSYLGRLWRYGLLRRGKDARGRVVYRLSPRGEQRLRWLLRV